MCPGQEKALCALPVIPVDPWTQEELNQQTPTLADCGTGAQHGCELCTVTNSSFVDRGTDRIKGGEFPIQKPGGCGLKG